MTKSQISNTAGYLKITNAIKVFEESLIEFGQDINHLSIDEYDNLSKDFAGLMQNVEFYMGIISSAYENKILLQNKDIKN